MIVPEPGLVMAKAHIPQSWLHAKQHLDDTPEREGELQ